MSVAFIKLISVTFLQFDSGKLFPYHDKSKNISFIPEISKVSQFFGVRGAEKSRAGK
jgi:hypothetical protein